MRTLLAVAILVGCTLFIGAIPFFAWLATHRKRKRLYAYLAEQWDGTLLDWDVGGSVSRHGAFDRTSVWLDLHYRRDDGVESTLRVFPNGRCGPAAGAAGAPDDPEFYARAQHWRAGQRLRKLAGRHDLLGLGNASKAG